MGANLWAFNADASSQYWLEVEYDNTNGDYQSVSYGGIPYSSVICEEHTPASGTNWNQVWDHLITPSCGNIMADVVLWPNNDCTQ
jgi:hypothetical protein